MMQKTILSAVFFMMPVVHFAQQHSAKDSLLHLLATTKTDTTKANLYFAVAEQYENATPDSARYYISLGSELSKKISYKKGILKSYRLLSYVLSYQSKFDSVIYFNKLALDMARADKDSFNIGVSLFNIGSTYRFMSELDSAVQYILAGAKILEGKGYTNIESTINDGLQALYLTLGKYDLSIMYGEKAVALARQVNDQAQLANALTNLGLSYADQRKTVEAKKLFNEALTVAKANNNKSIEAMTLNNLSDIAIRENDFEKLKIYGDRSTALATELQDDGTLLGAKLSLAVYYLTRKEYDKAKTLAEEALGFAQAQNLLEGKATTLQMLSAIAFAMQDYKKGFQYYYEREDAQAKAFTESMQQKEANLRIKYETEKKDNQIKLQQAQIQKKNTLNYLLIGSAAALLVISLLSYHTYRQKQKLQQQRIAELETQQQLTATEAVLKGEEQERTRLAKDLHDGLGGMLSGIKFSMNTMKGNLIMTPDNAQAFERSMDMLDSSIKEMRRVAHNLMPEALVKFGLDTALKDFCNSINQTGALKVSFQSIGLEHEFIDQTTAITVYRIIQELINNTIKHAAATQAIVQLSKSNDMLSVTVEDDGKGFDTTILKGTKGIGWSNIQSRVDFMKGKLDVQSEPGNGTSVMIELAV
ncbi:tetratricopeptide repeat protein [Ferruginibacter paludis]|uniref:tetratricopeptide repeat-containing sensor histidine kinase n=1 Tax=Ferruginibacter paludis TaxID=1310417 RepID=UPI0025B30B1F|nr:tetratricopeptide repeat protein [Ferruginibacter paludis]MDN3655605.1 tetratricopeptide repeat protein [Ferruginibacter paludis]